MSSPPQYLTSVNGPFSESRIGTVVLSTPNSLFVDVGGTVIETAFILPFVIATTAPPPPGTVVQLIRQDSSWICTGRVVGAGSNSVQNPSFEESAAGAQPSRWQSYNVSGASSAVVVDIVDAPEGDLAVRVSSAQSSVHYLYSEAIPVNPGESWSIGAFVGGDYGGGVQTADAALVALWFANPTNLYPTTSSADSVIATSTDVPQYPPFKTVSGAATVPGGTLFMRVALRSTLAANQALVWDFVTARRV